tara:strand:+ start:7508 stop:8221 length:714 start_codon:yes stop_codon:yes gene_type:complete
MTKHTIFEKKDLDEQEITIVIPCAGLGKRMKSYGPKPLIKIKNKTIFEHQYKAIKEAFNKFKIISVCGFEANKLMDALPSEVIKVENENYQNTNVSRSIGMGLRACVNSSVLILYGDLIFNKEALLSLDYNVSCMSVSEGSYMDDDEVGCIVNNRGNLENMMYDLPLKWNQLLYLKGNDLDRFKKIVWDKKNKKLFGFEAINKLINRGCRIKCIENPDVLVTDIDTSKDLEKARKIL